MLISYKASSLILTVSDDADRYEDGDRESGFLKYTGPICQSLTFQKCISVCQSEVRYSTELHEDRQIRIRLLFMVIIGEYFF